jgi:hypothetical protein
MQLEPEPDAERDHGGPFIPAVFVAAGIGILLIAAGVTPAKLYAPAPVVGAAGVAFAGGGAACLLRRWPRAGRACAVVTAFSFGVVLAWAALGSGESQFAGGLPFLGPEGNQIFGRVIAGVGALVCFALGAAVVRRATV